MIFFLFLIDLPQTAGNSCVSKDAYYLGLNMAASGSNISCLSRPLQSRFINCQDRFRRFNLSSDFPFSHNPQIPASFFSIISYLVFFFSFSSLFPPHFLIFFHFAKASMYFPADHPSIYWQNNRSSNPCLIPKAPYADYRPWRTARTFIIRSCRQISLRYVRFPRGRRSLACEVLGRELAPWSAACVGSPDGGSVSCSLSVLDFVSVNINITIYIIMYICIHVHICIYTYKHIHI